MKKEQLKKELEKKHFRVSIFGSAREKSSEDVYKEVYKLAKLLGEREIDLVTGGGPGLMEAAAKGHKDGRKNNHAHSIGLGIKLPREQKINKYVDAAKEFHKFSSRLDDFMLLSNAVIVAPGGVGTLLEFLYTWQLVQVRQVCNIPIILLGDMWPDLIKWLEKWSLKKKFIDKEDLNLLFLARDYNEAIKMIDISHEMYKSGDKNYCLNYKKYKMF